MTTTPTPSSSLPAGSVTAAGSSAPAGRLLLIAPDAAFLSHLHSAGLTLPLLTVENHLAALAHIALHGPPSLLIFPLPLLAHDLEPALLAFRRLAPQTPLLALTPPQQIHLIARATLARIDRVLIEPHSPQQLRQTLADLLPNLFPPASSLPDSASALPTAPAAPPLAPALPLPPSLSPPLLSDQIIANLGNSLLHAYALAPGVCPASPLPDSNDPPPPLPTSVPAGELGDVDLLNHLLQRRPQFTDLLLQLIVNRWDHPDIQPALLRSPDLPSALAQLPPGHLHAPILWSNHCLGVLHAPPPVSASHLAAWADWLAPWLALEAQHLGLWNLALHDELTGSWNRRYFFQFLDTLLQRAASDRFQVTLMVFDIDDFKLYNDRFGHPAGDTILREAARLMRSVVRQHDVVARIGGDEFAVIFWDASAPRRPNSRHPDDVRLAAQRFQKAINACCFPNLSDLAPGTLTISAGLAGFPWDGRTPHDLLAHADTMCLQSKRQGKNVLTFGKGCTCSSPPADPDLP